MRYATIEVRKNVANVSDIAGIAGIVLLSLWVLSEHIHILVFPAILWGVGYTCILCVLLILSLDKNNNIPDSERWFQAYQTMRDKPWRIFLIPGQVGWIFVPVLFLGLSWWAWTLGVIVFLVFHMLIRSVEIGIIHSTILLFFLVFYGELAGILIAYTLSEVFLSLVAVAMFAIDERMEGSRAGARRRAT